MLKKVWGIDLHKTQLVGMWQARYMALDARLTTADEMSLKNLLEGFGLTPTDDWYLHNAGNDAVLTFIVTLLAGLRDHLHPESKDLFGFPSDIVQGRPVKDIVTVAIPKIKAGTKFRLKITVHCSRCNSQEHFLDECDTELMGCGGCLLDDYLECCPNYTLLYTCKRCGSLDYDVGTEQSFFGNQGQEDEDENIVI